MSIQVILFFGFVPAERYRYFLRRLSAWSLCFALEAVDSFSPLSRERCIYAK